jgi:hypothetical protein
MGTEAALLCRDRESGAKDLRRSRISARIEMQSLREPAVELL